MKLKIKKEVCEYIKISTKIEKEQKWKILNFNPKKGKFVEIV
jgi:hypothetical protein